MKHGVKFTDEEVKAWLNENCPDLILDEGWVYEGARTPIPGVCAVCDTACSPNLDGLKNAGYTHCASCSNRIAPEDVVKFAASHGHIDVEIYYAEAYKARGNENNARIKLTCPNGHDVDMWLRHFRRSMRSNSAEFGGCIQCAKRGYNLTAPNGTLYVSNYATSVNHPGLRVGKFGITNAFGRRRKQHSDTALDFREGSISMLSHVDPHVAHFLERQILRTISKTSVQETRVTLTKRGKSFKPRELFRACKRLLNGKPLGSVYDLLEWTQLQSDEGFARSLGYFDEVCCPDFDGAVQYPLSSLVYAEL